MSDELEKLHRDMARKLATDLLRDPVLVLEYRDTVFDCFEDSASEQIVTQWMTRAGYATRHELLRDELVNAPSSNLAAWDGAYVICVDSDMLVLLQINFLGVLINGDHVSEVEFSDGKLCFGPSTAAPWHGELRFNSLTPKMGTPISDGGMFQRQCTGKLWKSGSAIPEVANAVGATKRMDLPPSPPEVVESSLRSYSAAASLGSSKTSTFVDAWKGDYAVKQISNDPTSGADVAIDGPDYGITGDSDTKVKLTYIDPFNIDVTVPAIQPEPGHIIYTAGTRAFDLTFGQFGDDVRGFTGKVYPASAATPPMETNFNGVARSGLVPLPSDNSAAIIIAGLALAAGTIVLGVAAIIASTVAVSYADQRAAQREYEKSLSGNRMKEMDKARDELEKAAKALENIQGTVVSNVSDVGLFGESRAKAIWAKKETKRISDAAVAIVKDVTTIDAALTQLTNDILSQQATLDAAVKSLENLEKGGKAKPQDIKDGQDLVKNERDNLKAKYEQHAQEEKKRSEQRAKHEKLARDIQRIHVLG